MTPLPAANQESKRMPKYSNRIVLSLLCALTFGACATKEAEPNQEAEPKTTPGSMPASDAEKAALLAEHLPPGFLGEPNLSPAETVQKAIDKQLKKIQEGGEGDALKADAKALAEEWRKLGESSDAKFTVDEPECFKGGCTLVTRHASDKDFEAVTTELAHTDGFSRWNSGKFRSGRQTLETGGIKLTWVFHAPSEGAPAMQPEEGHAH